MSNLAETIQAEVRSAVQNDELDLPTLPEVALRIRDEAESDGVTSVSLAKVIGEDAGLSARLIKIANSPMFRATRTIEDLATAISRVGLEYAANLATGLAMQQMFQATSELIDRKLREIWNHATEVAAISSVIASRYARMRVDQATLAGLTHSIGALPILAWAEEHDDLLSDSMTLDRVIDSIHGSLGTMILQSWDFPENIALVPANYNDWERHSDTPSFIDVVAVANLESKAGSRPPLADVDRSTVGAYRTLNVPLEGSEEREAFLEAIGEAGNAFD